MGRASYPANRSEFRRRTWYERDPERLELERKIVQEFPGLALTIDEESQQVLVAGRIRLLTESGIPEGVRVCVKLDRDHPNEPPIAEDVGSRFPKDPTFHKFLDSDTQCVSLDADTEWVGEPDALRIYLLHLIAHLDRQLICEADPKRRWPGPERPHAWSDAYLEKAREDLGEGMAYAMEARWRNGKRTSRNEPCICGSAKKYKKCHLERVECLERKCGTGKLLSGFGRNGRRRSQKKRKR